MTELVTFWIRNDNEVLLSEPGYDVGDVIGAKWTYPRGLREDEMRVIGLNELRKLEDMLLIPNLTKEDERAIEVLKAAMRERYGV